MNIEKLYATFVIVVTLAWVLLVIAPRWQWTHRIVHSVWVPIALGIWVVTLQILKTPAPDGAAMGTMQAVVLLVGDPQGILMLWTLAMGWDLLAGAWLARDAQRHKIHHAWVVLCLIATYMLGIVGFVLYLLIRLVLRRDTSMDEASLAP